MLQIEQWLSTLKHTAVMHYCGAQFEAVRELMNITERMRAEEFATFLIVDDVQNGIK